jgi:cysteine sulfinate desulfinase/cysteine desulfurase-like protein
LVKKLLHIPPVLEQIQGLIVLLFPKMELPGIVRISIGIENTEEDIDWLLATLRKIARQHH